MAIPSDHSAKETLATKERHQTPPPLDDLKADAKTHLTTLLNQGKRIKKFQSNQDLLMSRRRSHPSYIDRWAKSYSSLSWWIKLALMTSTVSIAACVGLIYNLVLVFSIITFVLYSIVACLLENHHSTAKKRDRQAKDDIIKLEKSLQESVKQISEIEDGLQSVLTSLCEMDVQKAEDLETFEKKIAELEKHADKLMAFHGTLKSTQRGLAKSIQSIGETFKITSSTLSEFTRAVASNLKELGQTKEGLDHVPNGQFNDQKRLHDLTDAFEAEHATLSSMTKETTKIISHLKRQTSETIAFNQAIRAKLSTSIDKTLALHTDTESIITQTDARTKEAERTLLDYDSEKKREQNEDIFRQARFKQRAKKTNDVLERAAKLLATKRTTQQSANVSTSVSIGQ